MSTRTKNGARKGRVYRFVVDGKEYAAFIWQVGKQFCGSIDGNPQVPEQRGSSPLAVRDALTALLRATPSR